MPKISPFALQQANARRKRPHYLLVFFFIFSIPLFAVHLPLLQLPFFGMSWGSLSQRRSIFCGMGLLSPIRQFLMFIRPELKLILRWFTSYSGLASLQRESQCFLLAVPACLFFFLLSIELSRGSKGSPAFLPPLLLLVSPLFFTQSMLAQLDMPAMVLTLLSLLLFIRKKYLAAAAVSVALVLVKETGLVVPFVFFAILLYRRERQSAFYFAAPALALGVWLVLLHHATGNWLGDAGFAHYNVDYALHPVRMLTSFLRRLYYILPLSSAGWGLC